MTRCPHVQSRITHLPFQSHPPTHLPPSLKTRNTRNRRRILKTAVPWNAELCRMTDRYQGAMATRSITLKGDRRKGHSWGQVPRLWGCGVWVGWGGGGVWGQGVECVGAYPSPTWRSGESRKVARKLEFMLLRLT